MRHQGFQYIFSSFLAASLLFASISMAKSKQSSANQRIMDIISGIQTSVTDTHYSHVTRVNPRQGKYHFDCSGMAVWILKRSAPGALESLGRPNDRRPLAVHFYQKIARIPPGEKRGPWYRIPSAAHIQPGDIIAWKRPQWFNSTSTGHVAFAVDTPRTNHGEVSGILVKVADASKFKHENDSRSEITTGFGTGTLLLPTDRQGQPLGYGWIGSETPPEWIIPASLVIGRALR